MQNLNAVILVAALAGSTADSFTSNVSFLQLSSHVRNHAKKKGGISKGIPRLPVNLKIVARVKDNSIYWLVENNFLPA